MTVPRMRKPGSRPKKPSQLRARAHHKPDVMNGLESAYADYLDILMAKCDALANATPEIKHWMFEPFKLRLAIKTFYTPDFLVVTADDLLEIHEVKGFVRDDAIVKLKVAAEKFPFKFIMVRKQLKKDGGGWKRTEF